MEPDAYHPLMIEGDLIADMQGFLTGAGPDRAAAGLDFLDFCAGDAAARRPPLYAAMSRTVARVDNDGKPPPEVSVFDWGGHFFGVPELRVWYFVQGRRPPRGIGAFRAAGAQFPEVAQVEPRIRALLGDNGCYMTVTVR